MTAFCELMIRELGDNQHKGPPGCWEEVNPRLLLTDAMYHAAKLARAIKDRDDAGVKEFAADVANMAMMVLEAYESQKEQGTIKDVHVAWVDHHSG